MKGERRAEGVDVGESAAGNRGDIDEVGGGAKVDTTLDDGGGGDVSRCGEKSADTDRQDTGGTGAAGLVVGEGAQVTGAVGTVVVEGELPEGVVPEKDDGTVPVDGDFVVRVDGCRPVGEQLAGILPGTMDDEALGRIGSERDGSAGGGDHD